MHNENKGSPKNKPQFCVNQQKCVFMNEYVGKNKPQQKCVFKHIFRIYNCVRAA
jgi:hypothetical protein